MGCCGGGRRGPKEWAFALNLGGGGLLVNVDGLSPKEAHNPLKLSTNAQFRGL